MLLTVNNFNKTQYDTNLKSTTAASNVLIVYRTNANNKISCLQKCKGYSKTFSNLDDQLFI